MRLAWALALQVVAAGCGQKSTASTSSIATTKTQSNGVAAAPALEVSPQKQFWNWFEANEDRFWSAEIVDETMLDEIETAIRRVDSGLTFEIGPVGPTGKRDFVVSADGIKEAFPAVEALIADAPTLDRWTVVKFRPRRRPAMTVEMGGVKLGPDEVQYKISRDGEKLGLDVCIDGFGGADDTPLKHLAYLLLDQALGEYDVETKVGFIEFASRSSKRCVEGRLLRDLPADFDAEFSSAFGARTQ